MRRLRSTVQRTVMAETIETLRVKIPPVKEGNYLLGLSGGADSVALLMILLPAIREDRIRVEAVHVNHGLRGRESDEDALFCSELCKKEKIPLSIYNADLSGRTDEASAREARFAAFRKRYAETHADALILAHHADDQAETFLMRLLRGAGPDGLACMKTDENVVGIRILRPMLSLRREEIREALRTDGIIWREDRTNTDTSYLRNRIRYELIPMLNRISGTAVDKICRAALLSGEDNLVLNAMARSLLDRISDGRRLDAYELAKEPTAIRKRALRIWWQEQGPSLKEHTLNASQTELLEGLLETEKGKVNLPGGLHAVRERKFLFLTEEETTVPEPATITGAETVFGSFRLIESETEGNPGDGKRTQEVPSGFARGCVIRTRQPGDRIRPFGSNGYRKLQDFLTDRQIAEPFRDQIPLMCRDKEVFLVCGVGAGAIPNWDPEQNPVRLTWLGKTPWNE